MAKTGTFLGIIDGDDPSGRMVVIATRIPHHIDQRHTEWHARCAYLSEWMRGRSGREFKKPFYVEDKMLTPISVFGVEAELRLNSSIVFTQKRESQARYADGQLREWRGGKEQYVVVADSALYYAELYFGTLEYHTTTLEEAAQCS